MRLLQNLKVGTRIAFGFGIVVTLLVFLAVYGVIAMRNAASAFDNFAGVAKNAVDIVDVLHELTEIRRNVIIYASSGDEGALIRIRSMQNELSNDLHDIQARVSGPERREGMEKLQTFYREYFLQFSRFQEFQQKRNVLMVEKLRPVGPKTQKVISALVNDAMAERDLETAALAGIAEEALMQGRIAVARFMEGRDLTQAPVAREAFATFAQKSAALEQHISHPGRKALAREAASLASSYLQAFNEAAAATIESQKFLDETLATLAAGFADAAEQIMDIEKQSMHVLETTTVTNLDTAESFSIGLASLAVVLALIGAFFTTRSITLPVGGMTSAMVGLAAGNLTIEVPARTNRDEIGAMARAVQVFKENLVQTRHLEEEAKASQERAEVEKRQTLSRLADDFETSVRAVVEGVSTAAESMETDAQTLSTTADQTNSQSLTVAAAAEQASANVATVAAAAEALSSSIDEIGRQVQQSARIANAAVDEAHHTNTTVVGLVEAAQRIGEVTQIISSIAGQTNLLALNATIEAARAGEAGKGFAVVASEVKNLANQTGKATDEITAQINAMQTAATNAAHAIKGIAATIEEMNGIVTTIATAVEEQTISTREIARNVEQAAAGTQEVSSTIISVTDAAARTGHVASDVLRAARTLTDQADSLRQEVENFITKVRVA